MKFTFLDSLVVIGAASLIIIAMLSGCTVTKYVSPTGESFTRSSFGTKLSAGEISVNIATNGSRSMSIKGYSSDQVEGLKAVTEAAVSAAIKSVKP